MIEKVENYMDRSLVLRYLQLVFTYFSPLTLIVSTIVTVWLINYNRKRARLVNLIEKIPGPPALPFIGVLLKSHPLTKGFLIFKCENVSRSRQRNRD